MGRIIAEITSVTTTDGGFEVRYEDQDTGRAGSAFCPLNDRGQLPAGGDLLRVGRLVELSLNWTGRIKSVAEVRDDGDGWYLEARAA